MQNFSLKKDLAKGCRSVDDIALTFEEAEFAFEKFKETLGKKHPIIIRSWENN